MITVEQFDAFINRSSYKAKRDDVLAGLIAGAEESSIDTLLRWSMWLAQTAHETGGYKFFVEQGPQSYFSKYDGRVDLGNDKPGDGWKYRGRSFLQLTGKANYKRVGNALGIDISSYPDQVENNLVIGGRVSGYFWKTHNLNMPSDNGDIKRVTKLINGWYNGLYDRIFWYTKAKKVLGI